MKPGDRFDHNTLGPVHVVSYPTGTAVHYAAKVGGPEKKFEPHAKTDLTAFYLVPQ